MVMTMLCIASGCTIDKQVSKLLNGNCRPPFSMSVIDDSNYVTGSWRVIASGTDQSEDPWVFHSSDETNALPYAGRYDTYPGKYSGKVIKAKTDFVLTEI